MVDYYKKYLKYKAKYLELQKQLGGKNCKKPEFDKFGKMICPDSDCIPVLNEKDDKGNIIKPVKDYKDNIRNWQCKRDD